MNNEYKEMLERFDQICQNAKKELLCEKEENDREQEINRLNNIIKNLDKMFEYYFLGNLKYDQDTVNTIYIKYVKLKGDNK